MDEARDDDPGGAHGRGYGRGGPDRRPDLPRPVHVAGPGGRALRAPARPALRGAGAGGLPARRGHRRAGLRGVQGRSRRAARAYRRVPPPRPRALLSSFLLGCVALAVIYAGGAVWLSVVTDLPLAVAVAQGVLIFVPFDLIKVALAALVAVAAAPAIAPSRV